MIHPARALCLLVLAACAGDRDPVDTDPGEVGDLLGILVAPERVVVPLGDEVQLRAKGLRADRTTTDLTAVVTWSSDRPSVASVSNDLDHEGVLTGLTLGEATVTASLDGLVSVPADVTVSDAALVGLTVEPKKVDLQVGDTVSLTAWAAFSDGDRSDASSQVRWITGDGGVAQVAAGGKLTAAGTGSTSVHADWDGTVSPDVPVTVVQQAAADLRISGLTAESGGGTVSLTATVENAGDKGASSFFVDAWFDPDTAPSPGDTGDSWTLVDYLGAGESKKTTFTFSGGKGSYDVWVIADTEDYVPESDEGNNVHATTVTVSAGGSGPNLAVDYFDWIADDVSIYYVVDVVNSGSEGVDEFYVDVFVDAYSAPALYSDGDAWTTVQGLDAGEVESADFLIDDYCVYCWSWVLVDSYDYVEETDETDNTAGPLEVESE